MIVNSSRCYNKNHRCIRCGCQCSECEVINGVDFVSKSINNNKIAAETLTQVEEEEVFPLLPQKPLNKAQRILYVNDWVEHQVWVIFIYLLVSVQLIIIRQSIDQ